MTIDVKKNTQFARKPRVLWAAPYSLLDTSSGASIAIREMLLALQKYGWEVDVVSASIFDSPKGGVGLNKLLKNPDVKIKQIINIKDNNLIHRTVLTKSTNRGLMTSNEEGEFYRLYIEALDTFKPDLVYYYGGLTLDLLIPNEARLRSIPVAAYLANGNYVHWLWCRDVDVIITDSKATAKMYENRIGFKSVPVGAFIDPLKVMGQHKKPERLTFINPSYEKGAAIVALLAILMERKRPDITFEIVESRGDWGGIVAEVCKRLNLSEVSLKNVVVTPHTNDMRSVYSRAKLLLAPSLWWESSGRVLVEAMLNGVPAIVTGSGGMVEMVGKAGIVLHLPKVCHEKPYMTLPKPELFDPLIKKIEDLYDNHVEYDKLSKEAFELASSLHGIDKSLGRLVEAFTPYISQMAGDIDQNDSIRKNHKHNLPIAADTNWA